MARVETARVAAHGDQARFLLNPGQPLGILQCVRDRYLDHDVLAGAHALLALIGMHLRGRSQDGGLNAWLFQALGEIARPMRNAELSGDFFRAVGGSVVNDDEFPRDC